MRLTWKDGLATLLTACAVALYALSVGGASMPIEVGTRIVALVVLLLGIGACAAGGSAVGRGETAVKLSGLVRLLAGLGVVTLVAGVIAVSTASEIALAVLVAATVALWLVATLRHALTGPTTIRDGDPHRLIERERPARRG